MTPSGKCDESIYAAAMRPVAVIIVATWRGWSLQSTRLADVDCTFIISVDGAILCSARGWRMPVIK